MYTRSRKGIVPLLTAVLLSAVLLGAFSVSMTAGAAPDNGGRVPYQYAIDDVLSVSRSDSRIAVLRDLRLDLGQPLTMKGWLATDEGVSAYQYLWLPAGGGSGEWTVVTDASITSRPDLAAAGIPYPSGHATAGFSLTIQPPDLPEGCYDVYVRALDGMGVPCDLVALLNLRYGQPDLITASAHTVSIPRVMREGEDALFGGATVTEEALILPPDGGVRLGELNLAAFEELKITYEVTDPAAAGKTPVLGLKSAGEYSYGKGDEAYNVTHSLAYTPIHTERSEVVVDLRECNANGEVWLTGHLNGEIRITELKFVCNGYAADRVAALIRLNADLAKPYFTQLNQTELKGITDPVLGDVLRMEVRDDTNDPYAFFNAGGLLKDHDIVLDADEYTYMVLLYRASPDNNGDRMNLYLCSGAITGATEDCNHGVSLKRDGGWHYLLVDLTQRENWEGVINGWRFDYVSAASDAGDYVDFASVQFFRTYEAAQTAASRDPAKTEAFHMGDTPVIRDMCEEQGQGSDAPLTIDPADTYEVTEPPTEPPTDPSEETDPDVSSTPADTTAPPPAETNQAGKGCRSALSLSPLLSAMIFLAPALAKRKKTIP